MESNPVTTAKSTIVDSSSPSPVEIFDGNSCPQATNMKGEKKKKRKVATLEKFQSQQKIENTPVTTTAEANNGDSLSPVERARRALKRVNMIREEKMGSRRVIAAKAARDYSQGKMESNSVTTAKSTSSPSPVEILDGNSSPQATNMKGEKEKKRKVATLENLQAQKIENTSVTTAAATDGYFLSLLMDVNTNYKF